MPIHKTGDTQTLKHYHPVSLLPIFSKTFERLIYNVMFGFFLDKDLLSANQSGFKPSSSWVNGKAGVPQGSILGPLSFLVYINDLADGLSSNTKLFADDASLFSAIHDSVIMTIELNSDLSRITQWAFQWKINFNPDPNKRA